MLRIIRISARECGFLLKNPIYLWCMVLFPILVIYFFTSFMESGQPLDMPVGVVDLDNSATSHNLIRRLDSFETTQVVGQYPSVSAARQAMQRNQIYAFLYIPRNMSSDLVASRHPKVSFYYSYTSLTAGSLLYRDLKTIASLGSAGVGSQTLQMKGLTPEQIQSFLQPVVIDLHPINNPWIDYNMFLSTMLIPGALMIFIFLITAYSLGTELKFGTSKEWLEAAGGNIYIALTGKFLPQFLIFLIIMLGYDYYIFGVLDFSFHCSKWVIFLHTTLAVLASQAFGIFAFGLTPSLRMSMSICSLWAVLGFTACGAAFPLSAMDTPIQAISILFPLRHYYMIHQICILNGFPITEAIYYFGALVLFILLPLFFTNKIRKAMLEYVYIP